ncbi:MAG: hypothetical protein ACRERU_11505 [Methylococcales bacterium]
MFRIIMALTLCVVLMMVPAVTPAAGSGLTEPFGNEAGTRAGSIHADCVDHNQPRLCTRVVEALTAELDRFNEAFADPDADQLAAFYHEGRHPLRRQYGTDHIWPPISRV